MFTEKAKENLLAMLEQAKISAVDNTDAQAFLVPSLYPEWEALKDGTHLTKGQRCTYNKVLYNVLSDHDKQNQWTPEAAPSLFAKVLIPDPSVTPDWEQPGSTNGYKKGDKVKVLIKKLYTIDENTTNILVNKALDDSELYYI